MKPNFTDEGIQVQTFEEIFNELVAGYQAIYGDIDFSQNTKDGQIVGIEAVSYTHLTLPTKRIV